MIRALLAATAVLFGMCAPATSQTVALVGATVLDGTGGPSIEQAVILIDGDRLTCVGTAGECAVPAGVEPVNLSGRFITPGLVDAHVHFSQTGWFDGRPDGLSAPDLFPYVETANALRADPARWHRSYLCSGITAVYDVGGHPWTTALPAQADADAGAAHVRAAGPLITHVSVPALNVDEEIYTFLPMSTPEEVQTSIARLVTMGSTAAKVWYLTPSPERRGTLDARLMDIGAAAEAAGLDLIVHATRLREAKMALRAGATLLVHSVQDEVVDDEFLALMAVNEAVYAPTLIVGRNWSHAMASVIVNTPHPLDDPNGCVDPQTVEKITDTDALQTYLPERLRSPAIVDRAAERNAARQAMMATNLRRVHEAGLTVVVATDAGNPLTLHGPSIYEEMETMQEAGLSPSAILMAATRNGARAMGRLDDFGTLAPGKLADLIVLSDDPTSDVRAFRSLTHVMRAGVLYEQQALRYR